MKAKRLAAAGAALVGSLFVATAASAQNVQVGTLTCNVSGGIGFIVTSSRTMNCAFRHADGRRETYQGRIRRFGLDIGATAKGRMIWAVFAPSGAWRARALAGEYAGASGEVSLGGGLGANALIGGFRRSITLQPLSVQAQVGVNLAVGVAGMRLN